MPNTRKYIGVYLHCCSYYFKNSLHEYCCIPDIGANLTDLMYEGIYNGSQKHQPDLLHVLKRSWNNGLAKIIVTGGSLSESKKALNLVEENGTFSVKVQSY